MFKISGILSTNNYLTIPKKGSDAKSLCISGRYVKNYKTIIIV